MRFDTRTIPDFLSDQEIEIIEQIMRDTADVSTVFVDNTIGQNPQGHHAETHSIFLDFPIHWEINKILMPKLRQHFGQNIQVQASHILNSYYPYGIHTDVMSAGFDPAGPDLAAWTFIIPLADYDSHTIVFEQGHDTVKTLSEWIATQNPQAHKINDELWYRYLSHCDKLDLQYLDVESIFSWRRGALFAADRRKFHTSDNFRRPPQPVQITNWSMRKNLKSLDLNPLPEAIPVKRAIIIWSTVPRQ